MTTRIVLTDMNDAPAIVDIDDTVCICNWYNTDTTRVWFRDGDSLDVQEDVEDIITRLEDAEAL